MTESDPVKTTTVAIVLAAGASRRLGQPKQLLAWHGKPLLVHCIETLIAADCDKVVVVLGAQFEQCQYACSAWFADKPQAAARVLFGTCENWENGQSVSLNFGLQLARARVPQPFQVLVSLCDQPLLTAQDYRQLLEAVNLDQYLVAAAHYAEGGGAPACFHHRSQWLLSQTSGDRGAKSWIRQQARAELKLIDFHDRTQDIDTGEALLILEQSIKDVQ